MSEPFIGEVIMFAGNFAPRGWMLCQGQLLSIAQNTALFSILGTTYGGNGTTNFQLPDFRGRVPVSQGQGPGLSNYVLGEVTGSESVTLLITNIPAHVHPDPVANVAPTTNNPIGNIPAAPADSNLDPVPIYAAPSAANGVTPSGIAGGSQPHNNIQPLLAVNFIIAVQGIFPSRN